MPRININDLHNLIAKAASTELSITNNTEYYKAYEQACKKAGVQYHQGQATQDYDQAILSLKSPEGQQKIKSAAWRLRAQAAASKAEQEAIKAEQELTKLNQEHQAAQQKGENLFQNYRRLVDEADRLAYVDAQAEQDANRARQDAIKAAEAADKTRQEYQGALQAINAIELTVNAKREEAEAKREEANNRQAKANLGDEDEEREIQLSMEERSTLTDEYKKHQLEENFRKRFPVENPVFTVVEEIDQKIKELSSWNIFTLAFWQNLLGSKAEIQKLESLRESLLMATDGSEISHAISEWQEHFYANEDDEDDDLFVNKTPLSQKAPIAADTNKTAIPKDAFVESLMQKYAGITLQNALLPEQVSNLDKYNKAKRIADKYIEPRSNWFQRFIITPIFRNKLLSAEKLNNLAPATVDEIKNTKGTYQDLSNYLAGQLRANAALSRKYHKNHHNLGHPEQRKEFGPHKINIRGREDQPTYPSQSGYTFEKTQPQEQKPYLSFDEHHKMFSRKKVDKDQIYTNSNLADVLWEASEDLPAPFPSIH